MNHLKKGSMLLSMIVIMSLFVISSAFFTASAIILSRSAENSLNSDKAYFIADSLMTDTIQKYMRYQENMLNPYTSWTSQCLREPDWICKMELARDGDSLIIDTWGKYQNSIRHMQADLTVTSDIIRINSIIEAKQ